MPKYVIGGKGCGKTHILRYFSYPLQRIREENIITLLQKDRYIGFYCILGGLNSSRFEGKQARSPGRDAQVEGGEISGRSIKSDRGGGQKRSHPKSDGCVDRVGFAHGS